MAELVPRQQANTWELGPLRAELGRLERALAEGEAADAAFARAVATFEVRYRTAVGPLYRALDELEAQIAERMARLHPGDGTRRRKAERLRAAIDGRHAPRPPALPADPRPRPSDELKLAYRAFAKRAHPDLGADATDRPRRAALMIRANAAYAAGDMAAMIALGAGLAPERTPDDPGAGPVADLLHAIDRAADDLARAAATRAEALETPIARYMRRAMVTESEGRDPFGKLVRELEEAQKHAVKRIRTLDRRLAKAGGPAGDIQDDDGPAGDIHDDGGPAGDIQDDDGPAGDNHDDGGPAGDDQADG